MLMANGNNKKGTGGAALGVAAAAAAAAAAAGAYWFYGSTDAAKHRKQVRSFMLKARADVLEALEKVKDVDRQRYLEIVDKVIARYSGVAGITAAEIAQMARDLRGGWQHMQAARSAVKKAAPKKATKKSPTKTAKKKS